MSTYSYDNISVGTFTMRKRRQKREYESKENEFYKKEPVFCIFLKDHKRKHNFWQDNNPADIAQSGNRQSGHRNARGPGLDGTLMERDETPRWRNDWSCINGSGIIPAFRPRQGKYRLHRPVSKRCETTQKPCDKIP